MGVDYNSAKEEKLFPPSPNGARVAVAIIARWYLSEFLFFHVVVSSSGTCAREASARQRDHPT